MMLFEDKAWSARVLKIEAVDTDTMEFRITNLELGEMSSNMDRGQVMELVRGLNDWLNNES